MCRCDNARTYLQWQPGLALLAIGLLWHVTDHSSDTPQRHQARRPGRNRMKALLLLLHFGFNVLAFWDLGAVEVCVAESDPLYQSTSVGTTNRLLHARQRPARPLTIPLHLGVPSLRPVYRGQVRSVCSQLSLARQPARPLCPIVVHSEEWVAGGAWLIAPVASSK